MKRNVKKRNVHYCDAFMLNPSPYILLLLLLPTAAADADAARASLSTRPSSATNWSFLALSACRASDEASSASARLSSSLR